MANPGFTTWLLEPTKMRLSVESNGGPLCRTQGWLGYHGLPVEIEVQKRLDLMSNEAIEAFGMAEFNEECRNSVWTYEQAWKDD